MVATLQLNDVGIRYGKREVLSGITTALVGVPFLFSLIITDRRRAW
jgi:hypothetical protein